MVNGPVRFGVIGAGRIAQEAFAPAVHKAGNAVLCAAASRDPARAREMNPGRVHDSYEALLADPEVEAVYVATHNGLHRDLSVAAMRAGKHVLCEKPLGRNVAECEEMIAVAEETDRQLVEAFMYRHHAQWVKAQELVAAGAIGELRTVEASFSYHLRNMEDVRMNSEWGGGGLLDVGCYCVNVCRLFLGDEPRRVKALGHFHSEKKVDVALHAILDYGEGRFGVISSGFDAGLRNRVLLSGTGGVIEVPAAFIGWRDETEIVLHRDGADDPERFSFPPRDLFQAEIEDLSDAIRGGGAPMLSTQEALANARIIDRLLADSRA